MVKNKIIEDIKWQAQMESLVFSFRSVNDKFIKGVDNFQLGELQNIVKNLFNRVEKEVDRRQKEL